MVAQRQALAERLRRLQAQMGDVDPFGVGQTRSAASLADMPRALGESGARLLGDVLVNPATRLGTLPIGAIGRGVLGAGALAQASPDLLRLLAGVATAPTGPNQPVETALAASEAGMGAGPEPGPSNPAPAGYHRMRDGTLMQDTPGMQYDSGQPALGAPAAGSPMPPTPPGGYTHGVTQVPNPAVPEGMGPSPEDLRRQYAGVSPRVDDIGSAYPGGGLASTGLTPMTSTSMVGQRVNTTPGAPGSLSRVDDIASSYSPRRILGMPGQTAAGLPLPSTLGVGGARGLSPTALEEVGESPFLMADILNQQRGRSPTTDMWAAKERGDATRLGELFPLFDDPNNPDDFAEQAAYLQRGIEGRRQPGGRLDFRGALLAKLGDEAGSGEVLQGLGIPMSLEPGQLPAAAERAGKLVNAVQVQGGRLPAMAAARGRRVQEEIIRQHSMALQSGEEFGQPQISAIIRSLA